MVHFGGYSGLLMTQKFGFSCLENLMFSAGKMITQNFVTLEVTNSFVLEG